MSATATATVTSTVTISQAPQPQGFDGPTETQSFHGFLFDLDGTIVDSTEAIVQHWKVLGDDLGVSGEEVIAASHGKRMIDIVRTFNPSKANWDYVFDREAKVPVLFGHTAVAVPGAIALIRKLSRFRAPWAIVTSGSYPMASGWLDRMSIEKPQHFVTGETVSVGKPDPEGYVKGAKLLFSDFDANANANLNSNSEKRNQKKFVVFEDAPAGVRAGKAAGHSVIAVATTHDPRQLLDAGADWVVADLRSVVLVPRRPRQDEPDEGERVFCLEIRNIWKGA